MYSVAYLPPLCPSLFTTLLAPIPLPLPFPSFLSFLPSILPFSFLHRHHPSSQISIPSFHLSFSPSLSLVSHSTYPTDVNPLPSTPSPFPSILLLLFIPSTICFETHASCSRVVTACSLLLCIPVLLLLHPICFQSPRRDRPRQSLPLISSALDKFPPPRISHHFSLPTISITPRATPHSNPAKPRSTRTLLKNPLVSYLLLRHSLVPIVPAHAQQPCPRPHPPDTR